MTAPVELEASIRQVLEEALRAATDRLALPLFDLGFLVHDLMGPAKRLLYVEPDLSPAQTPSALAGLSPDQQQRYRFFCDAAFAQLLTAAEVVTSLGTFRASARNDHASASVSRCVASSSRSARSASTPVDSSPTRRPSSQARTSRRVDTGTPSNSAR